MEEARQYSALKQRAGLTSDVSRFIFVEQDLKPLDRLWFAGYHAYLAHFSKLELPEHEGREERAALAMTWSWMGPAKFRESSEHYPEAAKAMRALREGPAKPEDVEAVARWTGNSLVAASKFLHFLSPTEFAIWDWRVAEEFFAIPKHRTRERRDPRNYLHYLHLLQSLDVAAADLAVLRREAGLITPLRERELVLFFLHRRRPLKPRKKRIRVQAST